MAYYQFQTQSPEKLQRFVIVASKCELFWWLEMEIGTA